MERFKYFFNSAVAVTLLLVAASVAVACGDDDDNGISSMVFVKTVKVAATVEPTADLLKVADITLSYTDDQGGNVTKAVTSEKGSLNVDITKFPSNGTVTCTMKLKANANIDANKTYKLSKGMKISLSSVMSDGTSGGFSSSGTSSDIDMTGDKVESWLSKHETQTYDVKIDKNGKF